MFFTSVCCTVSDLLVFPTAAAQGHCSGTESGSRYPRGGHGTRSSHSPRVPPTVGDGRTPPPCGRQPLRIRAAATTGRTEPPLAPGRFIQAVVAETWNRSAARSRGHPSSTTQRARCRRPFGLSRALAWATRTSGVRDGSRQTAPPHPEVLLTSRPTRRHQRPWSVQLALSLHGLSGVP